jgi:Tol biopolymer transport system component
MLVATGVHRAGRRRPSLVAAAVLVAALLAVSALVLASRPTQASLPARSSIAFVDGNDVIVVSGDPTRSGTLLTEETSGDESCCTLAWSPDGRHLLIGSDEHLSTVQADGSGHHEIVDEEIVSGTPAWSPDGTTIAIGFEVDGSPRLFVLDADGGAMRDLTPDRQAIGDVGSYAWSPDGRSIAFGAGPGAAATDARSTLDVVAAAGGPVRRVATAADGWGVTQWSSPAWSPDGASILYDVSAGTPLDIRLEIVSTLEGGASPVELSPVGQDAYAPVWSPDGRRIAFTVWRGGTGPADLYVMNADGTGVRMLADDVSPNDHPWSPDGASIVFGRGMKGSGRDGLWLVNVATGAAGRLSDQSVTGGIAWRPSD